MTIDHLLKLPGKPGSTVGDHILDEPVEVVNVLRWELVKITGVHYGGTLNDMVLVNDHWQKPFFLEPVDEEALEKLLKTIKARKEAQLA